MQRSAVVEKNRWWLTVILAAAFLVACDDDVIIPDDQTPPNQPAVATVVVNPQDSAWTGTLKVGQALTFAARTLAADGSDLPVTDIVWTSSDSSIVAVNAHGVVQAQRAGSAEVQASVKGKVGRVVIRRIWSTARRMIRRSRHRPSVTTARWGTTSRRVCRFSSRTPRTHSIAQSRMAPAST